MYLKKFVSTALFIIFIGSTWAGMSQTHARHLPTATQESTQSQPIPTVHQAEPTYVKAPAKVKPAAFQLVYDLPARSLVDDFPANALLAYQRQFDPNFPMTSVKQCGVFALWRVDDARGDGLYTVLASLNRIWIYAHPGSTGVAAGWIDDAARLQQIAVDNTPHIGSIAVIEANTLGAGPQGHAVYVAQIDSIHHTFRGEEENWTHPYAYDTRVIPWAGVKFVHFTLNN